MLSTTNAQNASLFVDLPSISISSGSLEFLKWFAFLAMIADHIDVFLFSRQMPFLYEIGRLVMPIFMMVLVYNLAQSAIDNHQSYWRVARRLFVYGLISIPIIYLLRQNAGLSETFPLNILFTLLVVTLFCQLWEGGTTRDYTLAILFLLAGGIFVEYFWPGLLFGVSVWTYFRYRNWYFFLGVGIPALGLICLFNGNLWAIVSIPIILVLSKIRIKIPRFRHIFYVLYPLHLGLLLAVQLLIQN
ncbi:MAG: TraX family protein [Candidatus Thiodiazotropha lotti]|uniref:Conjugal transfer protein TraX n=1 Tax=Candidatus Thiodiazotropha lotti TaxID=2792787 RepID=A0A9E4K217_9GAMM|nr:conjugal transfer protein TraX [Candidatus Thiodiazotropha lotti]MCW4201994.1 TraX family protein [Candidatus Thiodiazotropha lotti]